MVYGIVALAALQYSALGLLVSTYARTTDSALRVTYGCVFVAALLVLGPYQFVQGLSGGLLWWANLLRHVSPVPALMEVLGHSDVGARGIIAARGAPLSYLIVSSVSILIMMVITISRLSYRLFDRARSAGTITDEQSFGVRATRRLVFLVDPKRRKAGIGFLTNPLMVKEFRCRRFGRIHWLLRIVAVCALVSLALTVATTLGTIDWGAENIGALLVVLQTALIVLITPAIASGLISAERESGGWDMLRMTPLSAGAILRGKLMSVVWTLLLVLCATLPGYAVMMWIQPVLREQVLQVLVCVGMTALFAVMLSAAVGSLFRRTAPAGATAYAMLFAVCAGTLLVWLARDAPFGFETVETALRLNPLAAALSITETRGFGQYDLVPENWWLMGGASALLFLLLIVRTWRLMQPE
jgi:ABC-type transport system involved in multi-copper enzyme maturation permease subunit